MSASFGLSTLGQIALGVKDLDRAVAFWRDTLGVRFLFQAPPGLAFFDLGGVRLMLAPPERPEDERPGSVLYFRVDDIGSAHAALADRGVDFVDEPHRIADLGSHELWMTFFRDSEDNLLALMAEVAKAAS
jgi:predicted enzyme related to lactoylglutathione lyase